LKKSARGARRFALQIFGVTRRYAVRRISGNSFQFQFIPGRLRLAARRHCPRLVFLSMNELEKELLDKRCRRDIR
jgi:hypothetical protein